MWLTDKKAKYHVIAAPKGELIPSTSNVINSLWTSGGCRDTRNKPANKLIIYQVPMGNKNDTQWSSIVFEDEEDEENWFNWIEESDRENHSQFWPVSPNTHVSAVQPVHRARRGASKGQKPTVFYHSNNNAIKELPDPLNSESRDITDTSAEDCEEQDYDLINYNSVSDNVAEGDSIHITDDEHPKQFPTGEVNVSLSYDPVLNGPSRIKVQIVKARNLSCKVKEGKEDKCGVSCSESYIQVSLLCCHTTIKSQCTATKKSRFDVLFYETWSFDIPNRNLGDLALEITAIHRCKHVLTRDHVIGRAVTEESGTDRTFRRHWWEALAHPGKTINRWQTLWN